MIQQITLSAPSRPLPLPPPATGGGSRTQRPGRRRNLALTNPRPAPHTIDRSTAMPQVWEDAWLARSIEAGLPRQAELALLLAARSYHDPVKAEALLQEAEAAAPGHLAPLVGLYKFYFYQGRLAQALETAERTLLKVARDLGLPEDWRAVERGSRDFSDYADGPHRMYLFVLKAYGYLLARLGELAGSRAVFEKLRLLDPADRIGASVLLQVLDRGGRDDEDD